MDKTLCAYLAGAIDCDGSIQVQHARGPVRKSDGVRPYYYTARVTITQIDRGIVDLCKANFGGCVYYYENALRSTNGWHQWLVTAQRAKIVLLAVREFLILKQEQADAALRLIDLIAAQTARRCPGAVISDSDNAQRLALLREVRFHNSRRKSRAIRTHAEILAGELS